MNIPKAIEILTEFDKGNMPPMPPDLRDANHLGIEALTFVCLLRAAEGKLTIPFLKGETEE